MRRMRRAAVTAAVTLVALGLAGCGGSSPPSASAFKAGFRRDRAQFAKLGADIGATIGTASRRSNATLATEFAALADRAATQQRRLARLRPPPRYAPRLRAAVSELGHVGGDLRAIAGAAGRGDGATARSSAAQLVRDSLAFQSSERSLTQSLGLPASA